MPRKIYGNFMPRIISVFSILLFLNASISIASAAQSVEGQRIAQKQDLAKLKQKYQKAARKCCGLPDGTVDTTRSEYQRLLRRYNNTTNSTKLKYTAEDSRASQWETEARHFNLTRTGSNPKDIRADGDFVGDTHNVSRYRDHLREMGHDVVDYGYKIVDHTTDATVWRNEEQADLNAREVDPDVLQDMYEETGLDPNTHSPQEVIKEAKFIDDDAFSTSGGRASTGVKGESSDALGKVLDNEMKFRHAMETVDMKTMGKSMDKMAFPELKHADPEFYKQAETLRNYGDPIVAGIVDLGDSEAVAAQKINNWQAKAEAHIQENLALARQHSQTTRMIREGIAESVAATDPEMAERIRARNDRVLETNTRVENMNRATQDRMAREGKEPNSTEVDKYRNELQTRIRENVKEQKLGKEKGVGRKIETKMGEGTNIRQAGEELDLGATASRILHGIGLIMVAHDVVGRIERTYNAADEYKPQIAIEEGVSFTTGMAEASAGSLGWGLVGTVVGTAICPGIGTTIGSFAGSLFGGIVGYTKGDSWGRQQAEWISSKLGVNQNAGNKQINSAADKLYNFLLRKGVPKNKAIDATKLLLSGHLERFHKYMATLRAKYVSSLTDVMSKEKMSTAERANFVNCMCRNSKGSGMLGNHIDPDGGCVSCGPLSCWPVPIGTAKTTVLGCVNQLARARYRKDKTVFEEMHSLDEKTYRQKIKLIEEENASRVAEKRQKLERLRKDQKTLVEAGKLFLQIKDWLKTDDKNRLEMSLSSNLHSLAYIHSYKGKMDDAVASLEMGHKVRGQTTENDEEFKKFKKWQKNWKETLSKTFPKIRQQIRSGDLLSAESMIHKLGGDMLNGNRLPEADTSPEVLDIKKRYQKKKQEYNQAFNQVMTKIRNLESERDPRGAASLLKEFLHEWQIENSQKNYLSEKLAHDESLVRMADESARAGDMYTANANHQNAVKSYQDSLYNQRDSSVQSKLDRALSKIASLAHEKVQKILGEGRKNWKDGKLQQAIAKVAQAQKLAGKDKEISKTLKAMQRQKKMMDDALKKADKFIGQKKFKQAKYVLEIGKRISTKYPAYVDMLKKHELAKQKALQETKDEGMKKPGKNDISQSNSITILSATYGANCGVSSGNVTLDVAKECNGKASCRYTVDYKKIGDPAIGCRKTYSVQYRCGNNPQVLKGSLAAEAGWGDKFILLDCRQNNQPEHHTSPSNISSLVGSWSFGRSKYHGKPVHEHLCDLVLTDHLVPGKGYKIKSCHPNESYWILEKKVLLFSALDGTITTKFSEVRPNYWEGSFYNTSEDIVHYLRKSDKNLDGSGSDDHRYTPPKAAQSKKAKKNKVEVTAHEPNGSALDISGTWKWFDGETIHIYPNGTATDGFKGKWQANWNGSEFTYIINWNNGQYIDSLILHGNTLDGHNQNGTHVWGKRITSSQHKAGTTSTPNTKGDVFNGDEKSQTGITSVGKGSPRDLGEPSTVGKGTSRSSGGSVNARNNRESLTINKKVYEPNEQIRLNFTSAPEQNAWIGMYDSKVKHTYDAPNITYQNSDAKASGERVFGAPNSEGEYQFRLFGRKNRKELVVLPFTVKVDKDAASLTINKKIYEPNEKIQLKFTATPLENGWIGMYKSSTKHAYSAPNIAWQNCGSKASGNREFGAPQKEGAYEFRLYERTNHKELVVLPFTVKVDKDAASLTINKKIYEPNEKIQLKFTATPLENGWIGMYKSSTKHAYSAPNIAWQNCGSKASGNREFGAPQKEGAYEFRLYERTNHKELVVLPFTVKVDKDAASLTINKKIYGPNEKIQLIFTATPLENGWIGMYNSSTKHAYSAPNITWQNCESKARGVREFAAPNKGGSYQFRLYERTNHKELVVLPFSVTDN